MNRVQGNRGVSAIECINPIRNKWKVRWDIREGEDGSASWLEQDFDHKPTIEEVKSVMLDWHNQEIDKRILSGFVWRDIPVWLSSENQFNFKVAYDLTLQFQGANLPMTMKLGEYEDGNPAYFEFVTTEDFADFYVNAIGYIQATLAEGWKAKDSIDWKLYITE